MKIITLNIDPVNQTIEMSRAISELGVLIVLAALMVIFFIGMVYFVFKVLRNTNTKMLESQNRTESQNSQIIEQNKTMQSLLSKIAETESVEALLEQTKWNAEKLLRVSFDTNLIILLKGSSEILSHNHIADREFTEKRIQALVNSAHYDRVKWLNSFKYKGSKLGEIANTEIWIENKVDIIRKFIYSEDKNRDLLVRDLSLAYIEFNNQLDL